MGYELWAMSYELWAMSYELWAMGYELWAMSYGLWAPPSAQQTDRPPVGPALQLAGSAEVEPAGAVAEPEAVGPEVDELAAALAAGPPAATQVP